LFGLDKRSLWPPERSFHKCREVYGGKWRDGRASAGICRQPTNVYGNADRQPIKMHFTYGTERDETNVCNEWSDWPRSSRHFHHAAVTGGWLVFCICKFIFRLNLSKYGHFSWSIIFLGLEKSINTTADIDYEKYFANIWTL